MKSLTRRDLLRWAAIAAGSTTLAQLPSGILLADSSPGTPLGQLLDAQDGSTNSNAKDKDKPGDQRLIMPITFSKTVLRPDDLLSLKFDFINLLRSGDQLVRQFPYVPGYVIVRFPPQHIAEKAYLEEEGAPPEPLDAPGSVKSRMARESRLVFVVPDPAPIPYSIDGLLDWTRWVQRVADAAKPPEYVKNQYAPQAIVEPEDDQTAIEAPWRLALSPHADAGWANATRPVTHGDRTELWHTRLGERKTGPSGPYVDENDPARRTVRAIWSPDYNKNNPPAIENVGPFRTSLSPRDRHDIVRLTSDYQVQNFDPQPIQVNNLMLSTLGSWLDSLGSWIETAPGTMLDQWRQRGTMGRDHYVRVVYPGYLAPLGHQAVLTKITERKILPVPGANGQQAAYLKQRFFLVVLKPEIEYTGNFFPGRRMPLRRVRITNLVSPTLDNPYDPARYLFDQSGGFWPHVADTDHLWNVIGTDWDGKQVEFSMPLAFVFKGFLDDPSIPPSERLSKITNGYTKAANLKRRQRAMSGQRIAYAPSTPAKPGETSLETVDFTFGIGTYATVLHKPPFYGTMQEANVRLAGVEQAAGKSDGNPQPVRIENHPAYLTHGMPEPGQASHNNLAAMFVKVGPAPGTGVPLQFSGNRSGGVITPNLQITALSRSLGPTGGNDQEQTALAGGTFTPDHFFRGAAPKILGGIPLTTIIDAVAVGSGQVPKLVSRPVYPIGDPNAPPDYLETALHWTPKVIPDDDGFFEPKSGASIAIDARMLTKLAGPLPPGPQFAISGVINNFKIHLIPTFANFITLDFNQLKFVSEANTKPDISVDLHDVVFDGPLQFVNKLRHFLPLNTTGSGNSLASLGSDNATGPGVDVRPDGITLSYGLGLPSIGLGIFALKNISLGTELNLPFTDDPARIRFMFCDRADPGQVSVSMFSGTFFFGIALGLGGVEGFEAQIEFGGDLSIDLGVASGGVHVLAGIYYGMVGEESELTAHVRLGGELDILGLISISLEFYLAMTYQLNTDELWGQATLTVQVEVAMFSESVEVTVERRFAGSGDDPPQASFGPHGRAALLPASPTFADLVPTQQDWTAYCKAFA